jgi:crotonobetainyl-CoA:carnitine CoA-transferase CaiB-like acyl-CoA transferase
VQHDAASNDDAGNNSTNGPLADIRVIDLASVVAGPGAARHLGDFGADVIKVERPDGKGDGTRSLGWRDPTDDVTLWWKLVGRNKRTITLDLKADADKQTLLRLAATADVLIENFRPGTLERLGLGPQQLHEANPKLVITRVTGFGQTGPYAARPGFATLAEALSGFAAINGEPGDDSQPLLPPIALTDEVTALVAAFATMVALHSNKGQVVDVNLLESMLQLMGPLPAAAGRLGYDQPRLGSGIPYTVPRGTYRTKDGEWVAISTSSEPVAQRVLALVGLGDDEALATGDGRAAARHRIDEAVAAFIGERTTGDAVQAFLDADAAVAPVLKMTDVIADPHVLDRGILLDVDGDGVLQQAPVARLSETPGRIRWTGRPLGADTQTVLAELDQDRSRGATPTPTSPSSPASPLASP